MRVPFGARSGAFQVRLMDEARSNVRFCFLRQLKNYGPDLIGKPFEPALDSRGEEGANGLPYFLACKVLRTFSIAGETSVW